MNQVIPSKFLAASTVALVVGLTFGSPHALVINEIRIDEGGDNDNEYFELYGEPGESLDDLTYIVIGDGVSENGTVEAVIDLDGLSIPASGYFLCAEAGFTGSAVPDHVRNLAFENLDNVTHLLVRGYRGAIGSDADTNEDCRIDPNIFWDSELDRLAFVVAPNGWPGADCHYGPPFAGNHISQRPAHAFRCSDVWHLGPFAYPSSDTPGETNAPICAVPTESSSWGTIKARY